MAGELDSAVLVEPAKPPERLQRWRLFGDRYVVLIPGAIPWRDFMRFRSKRWRQRACSGASPRPISNRRWIGFALAGTRQQPRHRCASEDQLRQMVAAGLGIALSAEHGVAAAGIVARPLADPAARRDIVLAAVAGRQHGPALAAFLKLMRARDWRDVEVSKS